MCLYNIVANFGGLNIHFLCDHRYLIKIIRFAEWFLEQC